MRKSFPTPGPLVVLALAALFTSQLGASCGKFAGIRFDDPSADEIFVTDSIAVSIRTGVELGESSLEIEIDGVGLVAGLGLTPPFMGESGVLNIGPDTITITDFNVFTFQKARRIQATLSGFSPGSRELHVSGVTPETMLVTEGSIFFTVVDFLTLELPHVPAAGSPDGPVESATAGTLANASLGQAIAAPPVATLGGNSIRSGHVEAAEALISGGP